MNTLNQTPSATSEPGTLKPMPLNQQLISLLSLAAESTDEQIVSAVTALKTKAKAPYAVQTEFEKKVLARMNAGKISREAAELAQRSQDREDGSRAKITGK